MSAGFFDTAITLVGAAASVSPHVARFLRAAIQSDPDDPVAQRIAFVLPAISESEKAAADLRGGK